jgi:hypothetical protein
MPFMSSKKGFSVSNRTVGFTKEVKLNAGKYIICTDRIFSEDN